jgi:TolA-binding protein
MGTFSLFRGTWSGFALRLAALSLTLVSAPACISQMRTDIAGNQKRLDSLEEDLEVKRKELEEALAEASRVLRRNSADQGLQIEKIQQRLATMEGQMAELRHESSGTSKAQAEQSLALQRQLSEVARAAGMDVPIDSDEIPKSKSAHWEAVTKAYRINKYSYTRGLARAYVERYPKDEHADNAQYMIGSSYLKQGQSAAALGEFQKVLSTYRKSDALDKTLYDMSKAFLEVRSCNDASTALQALLKNHKRSNLMPEAKKDLRRIRALGAADCDDR